MSDVVLSSALRGTLASVSSTERNIAEITERFATGLRVNSAIDQPQNFFASQALQNTAGDLNRLLDGIGQSINTLETAFNGIEAISRLIDQAETIAETSRDHLLLGEVDPIVEAVQTSVASRSLSDQILDLNPIAYFRLNETSGAPQDSGSIGAAGGLVGGPTQNAPPLYANQSQPSVQFDGVNDRITVPNNNLINSSAQPLRTVELTFNADTVAGRQVLYEEGATVNGLTIYIDNGRLFVTAEDDNGVNRIADININAPIVAGRTYHAAFTLDAVANEFIGYLDGVEIGSSPLAGDTTFPSHGGGIGIGGTNGGVQFHDGESNNIFNFQGRISDVAIHNQALSEAELLSHAQALNTTTETRYLNPDFENLLEQIDQLTIDANYRGINLLRNDDLITFFNSENSNYLNTEGVDFTVDGLDIQNFNFNNLEDVDRILASIREARETVRGYGNTLATDLSVLQTRQDYTNEAITTRLSGADDLTATDQNEDGAELLASQTRQSLGITALSLAANAQASILELL